MKYRAEVYSYNQLQNVLRNPNIEMIYAPWSIIRKEHNSFSDRIILIPPVYLADCEKRVIKDFQLLKDLGFNKVLIHSIGHIQLFSQLGFNMYGGYRLNCVNSETIQFLSENGLSDIIVSPELTFSQISNFDCGNIGFVAYGYLSLMITRRCPIKNGKPCNKSCCNRTISDRKGNNLNIICSENTVEILNSDVLYLADKLNYFKKTDFAVLKFTIENNINDIISLYINSEPARIDNFTRGLYFRGIKE